MNQETGESAKQSGPSRPPRRSGPRRRGGRGRRRPERREENLPQEPQPQSSSPAEQANPVSEPIADRPQTPSVHQQRPQPKQSALSPIAAATAHVEEIIQTLKDLLRELEEVLEILDDAQRQQIGDSKEIEKLRRSLSMLQRERPSAQRDDSRGRFENRGRENRSRPPQTPEASGEEPEE